MLKLNPVLTPLRTATGSKPSTPSSGRSTPSGTDSEAEREAKQEAQREEADQLAQKLKELQKKIGSGSFGFATARPKQVENSPAPSVSASQIRSQTATVSLPRAQRSSVTPTGAAMTADTSGTTSASASMSQRGSIPDIPSPLSDSRARLPVRVTRRATSVGTRRSPSTVSEVQDRGPVGRTRAQDAGSGQVSSASSFSDLSGECYAGSFSARTVNLNVDTDMSASALEDALMSNNFKSTTAASRMYAKPRLFNRLFGLKNLFVQVHVLACSSFAGTCQYSARSIPLDRVGYVLLLLLYIFTHPHLVY
jgi:hypothetical protein